jgi:membrane-bound serine protease (ClpP class)
LIVLDAFTPTNGILTVGGVVGLLAGSLTLFDSPDRSIGLSWGTIVAVVGFSAAVSVFVLSKGLMIQRKRPMTGAGGLVGTAGTVRGRLDPDGTVFVHGEYWTARSIDGPIGVGEAVRVDRVEGKTLIVRRDG